jgi:hypothetical protein
MKQPEIESLALSIKDLLTSYVNGEVSESDAEERSRLLKSQYNDLQSKLPQQEQRNSLCGFCYYHNIENYSIYTGIFEIGVESAVCAASQGATGIDKAVGDQLLENGESFEVRQYQLIEPVSGKLKTPLHIFPFKKNSSSVFVVVALSSSSYFMKSRFLYFGDFLDSLFPDDSRTSHGVLDIFHAIEHYINHHIDRFDLYAQIYFFHDLDFIFSHAGTQTLFDVSASIEKQISDVWGEHLPRFTVSLKEYAVLLAKDKGSPVHEDNRKIDFQFKGIPLPCSPRFIQMEGAGAFYQFTDSLFSLSN